MWSIYFTYSYIKAAHTTFLLSSSPQPFVAQQPPRPKMASMYSGILRFPFCTLAKLSFWAVNLYKEIFDLPACRVKNHFWPFPAIIISSIPINKHVFTNFKYLFHGLQRSFLNCPFHMLHLPCRPSLNKSHNEPLEKANATNGLCIWSEDQWKEVLYPCQC